MSVFRQQLWKRMIWWFLVLLVMHVDSFPVESESSASKELSAKIVVTVRKRSKRFWEPWELNYEVCPPSLCTSSDEIRPRGTGGTVFYNGDIVLDSETANQIYGNRPNRLRYRRATARNRARLWKNGIVPYKWGEELLPLSKKALKKAMRHIEEHTCIRFRTQKTKDDAHIRFISEPGCWSNIGRVGGEQKVSIGRGCERVGTAVHEISHALGLWHEQGRPDRDKYIQVIEENVSPRYLPDFNKINATIATSRGFPYDYESVMHYSDMAFTNLGDRTIEVIGIGKKLGMQIGQRDGLSTLDIAQLRDMYYCNHREDANATLCPDGWVKKGVACYKFESKLRYQFAAAWKHCQDQRSWLLHIETKSEEDFIRRRLKKKYPDITTWRAGARQVNKTFVWHTGKEPKEMTYTNWKKGHPSSYSSMVLVYDKAEKITWEGAWLGSASQHPEHAYPFICERRAKRKCLKLKHQDGRDYTGTLDHTIDGITCQKWSSQYPHRHKLLPYPYKDNGKERSDGLGDHNYCRNPAGKRRSKPWCFTGKRSVKWQYCDVNACSGKKRDLVVREEEQKDESINTNSEVGNERLPNNNKTSPGKNNTDKKNSLEKKKPDRKKNPNKKRDSRKERRDRKNRRKNKNSKKKESSRKKRPKKTKKQQ